MRIVSAKVQNFASYKELEFEFNEQGLCLIQGATGSGKSTLCDVIPWVLFGTTAKNGAADDVIAWASSETTSGTVTLDINSLVVTIIRTRAPNDLYYITTTGLLQRGKDLKDTQKQINELLGMTAETYLAGAYFHEFSKTAAFFTTTAKNRREICEQIVDLSFVKKLQERLATETKLVKHRLEKNTKYLEQVETEIAKTSETITYLTSKQETFEKDKTKEAFDLTKLIESNTHELLSQKNQVAKLREEVGHAGKCKACGATNTVLTQRYNNASQTVRLLESKIESYTTQLKKVEQRQNTYDKDLEVYETKFLKLVGNLESLQGTYNVYTQEALDLELLQESTETLRKHSIEDTIHFIMNSTNDYLSNYFDAEIKVEFDVSNNDKIEVSIYKDGNSCSYTQLSKGQRGLLKLCFGVSVMNAVSNKSGIQFNTIFFDEALDGLDDTLKVKSYGLLSQLALSYENVFVVEHNEALKSMFNKSYRVTLQDGVSQIEES